MHIYLDPRSMSPEERLQEIAGIFAIGLQRLRISGLENPPKDEQTRLDLPEKTVLTVHNG